MTSAWKPKLSVAVIVAVLSAGASIAGAKGIDDFSLTKAIPSDAFFAVHARGHEGQAFVNEQMERVWAEFHKVRIDRDLKRLFKAISSQDGADPEEFEATWQQIVDLASGVDWANLASREYAMGMKLGFPTIEFVTLMMPPADKVEENFEGLSGIIKELVALSGEQLMLTTEGEGSEIIHRATMAGAPFPLGVTLARKGDVIVFGFGNATVEQAMALLDGEEGTTLASTDRFKQALGKLPAPTDSVVFVDAAKLMTQVRGMIDTVMSMQPPPAEDSPGYARAMQERALPGRIIEHVDIFEYSATVKTTDGMKTTEDSITVLRDDASSKLLYEVVFSNGTLSEPLNYIPVDAGNVSVTSGVDPLAAYAGILTILQEDVPDGEMMAGMLGAGGEMIGFDIKEDLLGWIKGGFKYFSLPVKATAYSPGEFVYMVTVRDEAKGAEMVGFAMDAVEEQFGENITIEEVQIGDADGFRAVKSPMLGMLGLKAPTIGLAAGHLIIGSSPEIIQQAFEVAAGDLDNFSKNERFKKEGIPLGKNVTAMSFTDMTKFGEQLSQALGMVGMARMMIPPEAQKDPVLQAFLGIVPKLGRVVRKVDFLLSSASQTTFEGGEMKTHKLINYREPPVVEKPAPPTESASD